MAAVGIGLAAASSREASTTRAVYRSLSWDSTLVLLGVASAAGIAAMNGGAAFLVGFGVHRGWTNEMSGWLLVVGSVLGLCARIAVGRLADRIGFDPLRLVAVLMSLGAIGALAMIGSATFPGAVVLMCAAGWGWPGLMHLAVLRSHGDTPAAATGVVEVGTYLGGGIGPAVFGLAIDSGSFELGWLIMGTIGLGAALMLWLAPRILDR